MESEADVEYQIDSETDNKNELIKKLEELYCYRFLDT